MTDAQLMTLALAIIIPLSMLIYSNSRITEAKETLRAEMVAGNGRMTEMKETLRADIATSNGRITDVKETLRAEMAATTETLRAEMTAGFSRISNEILSLKADLKVHELEHHHKLGHQRRSERNPQRRVQHHHNLHEPADAHGDLHLAGDLGYGSLRRGYHDHWRRFRPDDHRQCHAGRHRQCRDPAGWDREQQPEHW